MTTTQVTAYDVVGQYVRTQVEAIRSREDAVKHNAPDAVHKTRVATRRLRSTLRTFRSLFRAESTEPLRAELKWYGEMLGGPRDAEVLKQRLTDALGTLPQEAVMGPVDARLAADLDACHALTHAELVKAMGTPRYRELASALEQLASAPELRAQAHHSATTVLNPLVTRAAQRVSRRWVRAQTAPGDEQTELTHETRKKAKAARYACEALADFDPSHSDAAKAWERVTETLGTVQDCVVTRARLRDLCAAAASQGEPTFTYGVLYGRELVQQESAHEHGAEAIEHALAHTPPGVGTGWRNTMSNNSNATYATDDLTEAL